MNVRSAVFHVLCSLFLFANNLLFALPWPSDVDVVTEFGDVNSQLRGDDSAVFLALSNADGSYVTEDAPVIFSGNLGNGFGNIQVQALENNMRMYMGNLDDDGMFSREAVTEGAMVSTALLAPWSPLRKPLILVMSDVQRKAIVNPEIFLDNSEGNATPSLIQMVFRMVTAEGALAEPYNLYSWYTRVNLAAGEYLVNLVWEDGRFNWRDVENIYNLRLYVNGQLRFLQGLEYFAESEAGLTLSPGRSAENNQVAISLRPGINILELYIEDPKGLSRSYEFTINGGSPPPQQ